MSFVGADVFACNMRMYIHTCNILAFGGKTAKSNVCRNNDKSVMITADNDNKLVEFELKVNDSALTR